MVQEDDAAVCIIGVIININPGIIVSLKEWFNLNKRRWLASSSVLYFMNQNYKISLLNGVGSLEHLHHLERLTWYFLVLFLCAISHLPCEELGQPQPATPIQTDNITEYGIINKTFKQNWSKAIDIMQFYWLIDRQQQGQFQIYCDRSTTNLADNFTKNHPGSHHRRVRPIYLHNKRSTNSLQGCIESLSRS